MEQPKYEGAPAVQVAQPAVMMAQPAAAVQVVQVAEIPPWRSTYLCCEDCGGCCYTMYCGPCATCAMGNMIGSEEAKEHTSCGSQMINCVSYMPFVNFCVCMKCPTLYQGNYPTMLLHMAQEKLGKAKYPGPFGLGAHGPGIQASVCLSASCTQCLIYHELKKGKYGPAFHYTPETGPEWGSTYGCTEDVPGCLYVCCLPCCAKCSMMEMIDTDEARDHMGCLGQCKNFWSYSLSPMLAVTNGALVIVTCGIWLCVAPACIGSCIGGTVALCPEHWMQNFDTKILHLAKEKLGKKGFPSPLGLPRGAGVTMWDPITAPCTHCLIYRELKAMNENGIEMSAPVSMSR